MPKIPCGQSVILKSTKTDTGYGFTTVTACKNTQNNAARLVIDELTKHQRQYNCDQPCDRIFPQPVIQVVIYTCADCERLWWTAFLLVRCEATVEGQITLTC